MNTRAFAATLTLLAAVAAGCTSRGPDTAASTSPAQIGQPMPYAAGTGVVQAVTPAPGPIAAAGSAGGSAAPAASAKGPAAPADSGLQRLRIRMDNGQTVYVDTPSRNFAPGQRVQLSAANEIRTQ